MSLRDHVSGEHLPLRTTDGGIICTTRTVCYGINGPTGAVARSIDAGTTWQVRGKVPIPSLEVLQAIACPQVNTCVITN